MNMFSFMPYIWISVVVLSVMLEAVTGKAIAICFMPSAIIALVLSLVGVPVYVETITFFVTVVIFITLRLTVLKKVFKRKTKDDVDPAKLIGEKALVTEAVDNTAGTGKIKINGILWKTVSYDDMMTYAIGEFVELVEYRFESDRFICK